MECHLFDPRPQPGKDTGDLGVTAVFLHQLQEKTLKPDWFIPGATKKDYVRPAQFRSEFWVGFILPVAMAEQLVDLYREYGARAARMTQEKLLPGFFVGVNADGKPDLSGDPGIAMHKPKTVVLMNDGFKFNRFKSSYIGGEVITKKNN